MAPDIRNKEQMALFRQIRIDQGGVPEQVDAYLDSLIKHITYVREAGQRLGVDIGNLEFHDESKFSDLEFLPYVERYHGDNPDPDRYVRAWLHHIHHNPHHWQHWIFPDGFTPEGSSVERGVVKMPERYALEMVADWMGSSKAYTGSWDMNRWLLENMGRICLHSETAEFVRGVLISFGYFELIEVAQARWAHEMRGEELYEG